MVLIYIAAAIIAVGGGFSGHQPWFRLEKLDKSIILNSLLFIAACFTLLMAAYITGYFPQEIAAPFMMFLYSFLAGFFTGYGLRLIQLRSSTGNILYVHRSFWIDHAPSLAAILIILFGIYRTSLLTEEPVTGLRLTSGFSLIAFGFFGWTIKIVPEFRSKGVLFLDKIIPWRQILAWQWHREDVISIEYMYKPETLDEQVREFLTTIPPEDRIQIETVLESKMDDHRQERNKMLGLTPNE